MIYCVQVHSATPRIEEFVKAVLSKGKCENHVLHLISRKVDEEMTYAMGEELADNFLKTTTKTLPDKVRTANELGNDMFRAAFEFLWSYKSGPGEFPEHPLVLSTTDYRPTKSLWLDDLQSMYFLKQAVTMGKTTVGAAPKAREYVGPVVFGKKFTEDPQMLEFLNNQPDHWRQRLVWQLMKGSVETKLIGNGKESVIRKITDPK